MTSKKVANKPEAKKAIGRPSTYTPEKATEICELIAIGKSSREVCAELKIGDSTLLAWLKKDEAFQRQYAHARERQADFYVGQIISISDEIVIEAKHQGEDVVLDLSSAAVARNRLRVDSRKWIASKLYPKKYGEKLAIGGADDLPAVKTDSTVTLTPDEAYKRMLGG